MDFKIEKNVPLLANKGRRRYPFRQMEIGDSFLCDVEYSSTKMQGISNAARGFAKNNNLDWKFELRKTEDSKIRVWRTK